MYSELDSVLVSSGTQVWSQIILDPDYFPDYLSVPYDYVKKKKLKHVLQKEILLICSMLKYWWIMFTFDCVWWYTVHWFPSKEHVLTLIWVGENFSPSDGFPIITQKR